MKKRKEFNNILNECLERVLVNGETIEQCLGNYPEPAAELEPLLRTALDAKKASAIEPRSDFREKARYQFRAVLQGMKVEKEHRFFGWQPRWATAVIMVLVLLLASGGTVAAAANSMPDGSLYTVKLATELVRLTLTPSALGKAELYTKLADKRVVEMVYMANRGRPGQVEQAARRFNACLTRVARLAEPREKKAGVLLAPALRATVEEAPVPRERYRGGDGGREPIEINKRARLRMMVARNAVRHPAALRVALQKVPRSARPALRRAIAESDDGYRKALRALD